MPHSWLPVVAGLLVTGIGGLAGSGTGTQEARPQRPAIPAGLRSEEDRLFRVKDDAEMVLVEAGVFRMGSTQREIAAANGLARRLRLEIPPEALDVEMPAHPVDLPAFYLDRFEVTNEQYAAFVLATGRATPSNSFGPEYDVWRDGTYPSRLSRHPVVNVRWEDANAYCEWVGGRLPTEAEWEKGARGDDGRAFPWGDHWDEGRANRGRYDVGANAWKGDALDGHLNTAPVGTFPAGASPCGAEDMAGNVVEWVRDRYDPGYYAASPPANPPGPDEGAERGMRGGSWYYDPVRLRSAYRHHLAPDVGNAHAGFRCAHDAR